MTKRVAVLIIDDDVDEDPAPFSLQLSSPVGATVVDGNGQATLWDISPG